jgi:hypothetical protein
MRLSTCEGSFVNDRVYKEPLGQALIEECEGGAGALAPVYRNWPSVQGLQRQGGAT